jgi:hypothetical protein
MPQASTPVVLSPAGKGTCTPADRDDTQCVFPNPQAGTATGASASRPDRDGGHRLTTNINLIVVTQPRPRSRDRGPPAPRPPSHAPGPLDRTLSSWLREVMPSLLKTLRKWYWTVRALMNMRAPISGLDRPSRAIRAI